MANEISYQFQILLNNGLLKNNYSSNSIVADQVTAAMVSNVVTVPTSDTALDLGGVVSAGFAVFANLDDTNSIELGAYVGGTFYPFVKLEAGEQCVLRLSTNPPYAKASIASVKLYYIIYAN